MWFVDLCRVGSLPLFFASQAGYLVEELEEWPGQPEIRAGDVIVAIGEEHEAQKSIRESKNDTNETKRHMPCVLTEKSGLLMAVVRVLIRKTMKYTKPCCDSDDSATNRNLHSVCWVATFRASKSTMKIDEIFQSHRI